MSDPWATDPECTPAAPPDPPGNAGAEALYLATVAGMDLFTRLTARVEVHGLERLRYGPGLVLLATHRSERDVPLVCAVVTLRGGMWRRRGARLRFAAREDMFAPGFLAGFPPALPPWLRRALWRVELGRGLRTVRVWPLASATQVRLGEALAAAPPEAALADLLPPEARAALAGEAVRAGLAAPLRAHEALRGELAAALWTAYPATVLAAPALAPALRARRARATADLRALVTLIGARAPLLLFPEGRPSPDGALGPVRRGVGMLLRRGRPERVVPIAIAWDPLTRGRPYALLAFGPDLAAVPAGADPEAAVLAALRSTMPLGAGAVIAAELRAAARAGARVLALATLEAALARAAAVADAEGRAVHRLLRTPAGRRARLADALAALAARGLAAAPGPGRLAFDPAAVRDDPVLARLEREHESVRGPSTPG